VTWQRPDRKLDLRGVPCPMNYVRTKLVLEEMDEGQVLEVWLSAGEPIKNVPRSAGQDGHEVLKVLPLGEDAYRLFLRRR